MSNELDDSRVETVTDVSQAVLRAIGQALKPHGNDPMAVPIIAAGVVQALEAADDVCPGLKKLIRRMLKKEKS